MRVRASSDLMGPVAHSDPLFLPRVVERDKGQNLSIILLSASIRTESLHEPADR